MPITIQIEDNEAPVLIEFYNKQKQKLRAEVDQRLEQLEQINARLEQLTGVIRSTQTSIQPEVFKTGTNSGEVTIKKTLPEYNPDWTWRAKMNYCLITSESPLSSKEVVDRILSYEPNLVDDRKKIMLNVAAAFSSGYDKGNYDRIKQNNEYQYFIKR